MADFRFDIRKQESIHAQPPTKTEYGFSAATHGLMHRKTGSPVSQYPAFGVRTGFTYPSAGESATGFRGMFSKARRSEAPNLRAAVTATVNSVIRLTVDRGDDRRSYSQG